MKHCKLLMIRNSVLKLKVVPAFKYSDEDCFIFRLFQIWVHVVYVGSSQEDIMFISEEKAR
jgi:hypothetical protein